MIREIECDGIVYTADHWFEWGLPESLYDCLDGHYFVYAFNPDSQELRQAYKRIFTYPRIDESLLDL